MAETLLQPEWRVEIHAVEGARVFDSFQTDISNLYTSELQIKRQRNYPDEINFEVDLEQLQKRASDVGIDQDKVIVPYKHNVKVFRNNTFVAQGIVQKVVVNLNNSGGNKVAVSCVDILGILDKRLIHQDYAGGSWADFAKEVIMDAQHEPNRIYNYAFEGDGTGISNVWFRGWRYIPPEDILKLFPDWLPNHPYSAFEKCNYDGKFYECAERAFVSGDKFSESNWTELGIYDVETEAILPVYSVWREDDEEPGPTHTAEGGWGGTSSCHMTAKEYQIENGDISSLNLQNSKIATTLVSPIMAGSGDIYTHIMVRSISDGYAQPDVTNQITIKVSTSATRNATLVLGQFDAPDGNLVVSWGDDTDDTIIAPSSTKIQVNHTFPASDEYTIKISAPPECTSLVFDTIHENPRTTAGNRLPISVAISGCTTLYSGSDKIGMTLATNLKSFTANTVSDIKIPYSYFNECSNLERVLATGIEEIGFTAFSHCQSLTSVGKLGNTWVGTNAFNGCTSLKKLDFSMYDGVAEAQSGAFDSFPSTIKVIVPSTKLNSYKGANQWSRIASQIFPYTVRLKTFISGKDGRTVDSEEEFTITKAGEWEKFQHTFPILGIDAYHFGVQILEGEALVDSPVCYIAPQANDAWDLGISVKDFPTTKEQTDAGWDRTRHSTCYEWKSAKETLLDLSNMDSDNFWYYTDERRNFNVYIDHGRTDVNVDLSYPKNISTISVTSDAKDIVNYIKGDGSAEVSQDPMVSGIKNTNSAPFTWIEFNQSSMDNYWALASANSYDSERTIANLRNDMKADIDTYSNILDVPEIMIDNGSVSPLDFDLGDMVSVSVLDHPYVRKINGVYKIVAYDIGVDPDGKETIQMTLVVPSANQLNSLTFPQIIKNIKNRKNF